MGRQGKDFGGNNGERRFEGGRGQDFKARGGRPDGERRGGYSAGGSESRGGSYGDRNGGGRSFGGDRDRNSSFERRGPSSFGGRDDRAPQRASGPGQYRRPEGAQGGYGRPSAPRYDDAPRRPAAPAQAAPAAMAAPKQPVVGAAQLKAGIGQANRALAEVIEQFGHTLRGDYDIGAIEVTVSFAEDGRFLGFGAGGAACMKLSLTPLDAEAVMEGESADDDFVSLDDEDDESIDEVAMTDGNGVHAPEASSEEAPHFDA